MPATTTSHHPPPFPARKPPAQLHRQVQHLQTLLRQGKLSRPDYKLCLALAEGEDEAQPDDLFAWMVGITERDLHRRRSSLRAQGVLDFWPTNQPGCFVYWVREPGATSPAQKPELPKPSADLPRWIVLDQGQCAHRLRANDLFPTERTVCDLPANLSDDTTLPRLNCQPADYPVCRRCASPRSRFQVPHCS